VHFSFITAAHCPEALPHIARNVRVCIEELEKING
jgi:hypothetical protein